MKALVPLNNVEHIDDYIEAGAGEFYLGFYDEAWHDQFGEYADINRLTGFKKNANPYNLEEVINIIEDTKKKGVMMYVTFNASVYSQAQLDYMVRYMERLKATSLDGVIVSCPELVEMASKLGMNVVVSTISATYNEDTVKFYRDLGAKRIILPRDLSMDEIESIVKAVPDVEYEVFLMRNGCRYSDGNCLGFHRKRIILPRDLSMDEIESIVKAVPDVEYEVFLMRNGCRYSDGNCLGFHRSEMSAICGCLGGAHRTLQYEKNDFKTRHEVELNDILYTKFFHSNACGLCSVYRFVKMGIAAGKIVGRSDEWQYICRDINLIKQNVEIAKKCESEEEYLDKMILPEDEAMMCKLGLSCYYPEVRF